jgi:tungstate transport system ATP-binding protein
MKPGNTTIAVEIKDLSAVLGGQKIIETASVQVHKSEVLVIIGPNGSGKTTLLQCLALLLKPSSGQVVYDGVPVTDSKQTLNLRRRIAVVFQESLLLGGTVWDNITLGLKLRGVKKEKIRPRVEKWLKRFGIADLAKRQAHTLSGGEAKRVSLARAFALDPEVIFLDEPFTALDSPTRQKLLEDFEGVLRETGVTTVMVTHDRNEALALGDRVAVMMRGKIEQIGTPEEVFSSPVNEELAGFLEAGNIVQGVVVKQNEGLAAVKAGPLDIDVSSDLPEGSGVILVLPYDDITVLLNPPGEKTTSARNRFPGEVIKLFPHGSQMRVTIDCGVALTALITRKSALEMALKEGMRVVATVKAVSIKVIGRH